MDIDAFRRRLKKESAEAIDRKIASGVYDGRKAQIAHQVSRQKRAADEKKLKVERNDTARKAMIAAWVAAFFAALSAAVAIFDIFSSFAP